jgi:hypothetical protein
MTIWVAVAVYGKTTLPAIDDGQVIVNVSWFPLVVYVPEARVSPVTTWIALPENPGLLLRRVPVVAVVLDHLRQVVGPVGDGPARHGGRRVRVVVLVHHGAAVRQVVARHRAAGATRRAGAAGLPAASGCAAAGSSGHPAGAAARPGRRLSARAAVRMPARAAVRPAACPAARRPAGRRRARPTMQASCLCMLDYGPPHRAVQLEGRQENGRGVGGT